MSSMKNFLESLESRRFLHGLGFGAGGGLDEEALLEADGTDAADTITVGLNDDGTMVQVTSADGTVLDEGAVGDVKFIIVNAGDVYFADEGDISVDMSREASLEMDNAPSSDSVTPTESTLVSQAQSIGFNAIWLGLGSASLPFDGGIDDGVAGDLGARRRSVRGPRRPRRPAGGRAPASPQERYRP